MERIVHVHHVDKDAFLKGNIEPDPEEVHLVLPESPASRGSSPFFFSSQGARFSLSPLSPTKSTTKSSDLSVEIVSNSFLEGNIEPDPEEVDLVFDLSPSFAEVVAQVRVELNWNEPNDGVELEGRHNVGFGMHTRWKTMRINSEQRWSVYKETVAGSQDKALELFATKTVDARIELDLNRPSSPVRERSPPPMSQEEATQSPIVQSPIAQQPPLDNEYDEHDDGDDGFEMNDNNVGDLDKYWTQEEMDHSIPYFRCYASDSDDDGPEEEVDEDGLTAKEAERAKIFKKVTGWDIRVPLFRDVSLADGAVVDGGKSLLLGARPISKRDVDGRTAMISKGLTFDTFLELKIWLKEFSIKHHRPYLVVHSDLKKRYTLKCVDKRNPSEEIFSELDEINAQSLKIPRSFQNTREEPEGGHRAARHQAGAGQGWAAPPYGVTASSALRLRLFAYLKVPDLNLRDEKATVRETFQSRHREAKIGDRSLCSTRRRDGSPEGFSIDTAAISTAIFITAAVSHEEE
ncbi:hypothetical protein QYE76_047878 [Lolium multiflorum]|uniref:Uncharacterized protein n=1 Tax=Lolium multiflorum TaxID=4521 RepID=A0AAD8X010_LOLMU|nr:hypothetical protein QYE76_047878 [Lolium multiflorum]